MLIAPTRIDFEHLWNRLSSDSCLITETINNKDGVSPNYIIRLPSNYLKVKVGNSGSDIHGDIYSDVRCVSRHFVVKPIYTIQTELGYTVRTTADHTCIRIVDDDDYAFSLEQISAKDLAIGDCICVCEDDIILGENWCDRRDYVLAINIDENKDGMWVYDLEVESSKHVYFANGILVHNSQFINLSPITKCKCDEDGLNRETTLSNLPDETREKVIKEAYHILDLANANVERLVNRECHTTQGNILHYSLEYVAAEGMYFRKKCYIVRKILSDDLPCDKFKYSGVSVKKAEIPSSMKDFLKIIFESTMKNDWSELEYRKEVERAYNTFITLDWNDIAYYKKYRTVKRIISLTESEKGAGVHARAANFYNQLIEKLGLAGRYPKIGVGDEFRYLYVLPTNEYGMDCIAFKGMFPDEFRMIFTPDYDTMFDKIFIKSLKNYNEIMHFKMVDPTSQEESPDFEIF